MSKGSERVKRWRDRHRALHNLRRRNARKGKLDLGKQEPKVETTVSRIEMPLPDQITKEETLTMLRNLVSVGEEKPDTAPLVSVETRSARDVVGGIYRNDNGGVISKFSWEKLQKMKAHAEANNFEIDEYSQ